jgi:hypothetical protein
VPKTKAAGPWSSRLARSQDLAKPKIVRPQYEAGAIYEDFVFFFGAFFFFVAMVLFLDV